VFWAFAGFGLGWWLVVLLGLYAKKSMPEEALSGDAAQSPAGGGASGPPNPAWTVWIASSISVLALSIAHYLDLFGSFSYAVEGYLLSPGALRLATGFAVGLWASRYRSAIGARSREFYAALLGAGSKPSWALQSAAAILALTVLVVAINPDLMEHLESIKAGEVEAKFSSVSTATREARITLNPLENELAIQKWIGFNENYAGKSPRNAALMLFDNSEIRNDRVHIRNVLFDRYLEPLAIFLGCLEHTELLPIETRSASFVTLAVSLRNALVEEPKQALFDKEKLFGLLRMIDREIVNIDQIIQTNLLRSQQKTCKKFMFDPGNEATMTSIRWRIYGTSSSNDREDKSTEAWRAGSKRSLIGIRWTS
jgi:hypothetical protein